MKPKVFIDGHVGTTGLQIVDRLQDRTDIELINLPEHLRRDESARKERLNAADLVFLCLPDPAARHAVTLIENPATRVIDASTAHRTTPGWVYGFAELNPEQRGNIRSAARVSNPGCHSTGFIAIIAPLIRLNMLSPDIHLTCFSITGYSGGGREMIAEYADESRSPELDSPRVYGLGLQHKHIPEMCVHTGLFRKPFFSPIVADYLSGMAISVFLPMDQLNSSPDARDLRDVFAAYYQGEPFVQVAPFDETPGFLASNAHVDTNLLEILVHGNDEQCIVTARLDNLGKGASGAAVQNMNLMLGFPETRGL